MALKPKLFWKQVSSKLNSIEELIQLILFTYCTFDVLCTCDANTNSLNF